MAPKNEDHWTSEAYQNSASFVPKLATKVLEWLDVQPDDEILDVGCGDGIINLQIAQTLVTGKGKIHGIDSSEDMIRAASKKAAKAEVEASNASGISKICTFQVLDATQLSTVSSLQASSYDKVFSNAAMHWILRDASQRETFFRGIHSALKPNGIFVFEMGGMGNVAEVVATLLSVVGRRIGIEKARAANPWFFPDEMWMRRMLEETVGGFRVERIEREYRPTRVDRGGVEGWVGLMGKQFLDAVGEGSERVEAEREACEVLKIVCGSPGGGDWFGYVRLRAMVRKI